MVVLGVLVPELGVMVETRVDVEVIVVVETGGAGVLVSELVVMVETQVVDKLEPNQQLSSFG